MTEKSIGEFIQELRKENGLTQKELASQIGISDKTISKWENGNSVPDTSMLLSLCKALDISVNELLSGNKLPPEQYSMKAEENIMDLLKDKEQNSKSNFISVIMGIVLGILALITIYITTIGSDTNHITEYIDVPSLIFLILICAASVFVSGAKGTVNVLTVIHKTLIPAGMFIFLFSLVAIMGILEDITHMGKSLCVASLAPMYALLAYLILIPVIERLKRK